MGDTSGETHVSENAPLTAPCDDPKPSIDILKEVKPSENIAINKEPISSDSINTTTNQRAETETNIETVFKNSENSVNSVENPLPKSNIVQSETNTGLKPLTDQSQKEIGTPRTLSNPVTVSNIQEKEKKEETNAEILLKQKERAALKNKSDIFSLKGLKNLPPTPIFSVGGAPSKNVHKTDNMHGVEEAPPKQLRNPVTGFGVSSNDEYKGKPLRRRGKNTVLRCVTNVTGTCHSTSCMMSNYVSVDESVSLYVKLCLDCLLVNA